jgi:outer membrane protein assembly factor BamB
MTYRPYLQLFFVLVALSMPVHAEENWPQWRGAAHNGVSNAANLPTEWSETKNIVWKTPMPSWSGASPVIWGDRVFVLSPSADPEKAGNPESFVGMPDHPGGQKLLLLCLDKNTGGLLWEGLLGEGNEQHRKGNNASPSPVTDGKHVWAMTGQGHVAAFNMEGALVWQKNLEEDYGKIGNMFGYGSSPILHEGKLIVQVLHGYHTDEPSYLMAFDALTGAVRWRVERPTDAQGESPDAYSTPTLLENDGRTVVVVAGGGYVTGHDPDIGVELWRAAGMNPRENDNWRVIVSPVAASGMVVACTRIKPVIAVRGGGSGDVTESHTVWTWPEIKGPDVPTPACDGKNLYVVLDKGEIKQVDLKTGTINWGPEATAKGHVSASPLLADGKIYIVNEAGVTSVVADDDAFKLLATNTLDGSYTLSSPAVSGNRIFVRTARYLYCIGEK